MPLHNLFSHVHAKSTEQGSAYT